MLTWDCFTRELILLLTWRSQTAWSGVVFLFVLLIMQQVRPQGRFTLKDLKKRKKRQKKRKEVSPAVCKWPGWFVFLSLTCLTWSPWLQILSSRSHRLAIKVFSSTPVMLTSPWPNSTASRPIFSTSMRLVCRDTNASAPSQQDTRFLSLVSGRHPKIITCPRTANCMTVWKEGVWCFTLLSYVMYVCMKFEKWDVV